MSISGDMPLHEHLRAHARRAPAKTAIVWYGREISYGELDRLSDACAAVLHRQGVRKGEPVALFMQNCPQYVIAHLGIQKLGAIASPCSPLFKAHELGYQLGDLGAQVVIAAANAKKGEVVKAFIVPRQDGAITAEDVIAWSRENMSAYKVPRQIEFRNELPTTVSGKVLRRLL